VIEESENIKWRPHSVNLNYYLGEIKLFQFSYKGIRYDINIFKSGTPQELRPPIEAMKEAGVKIAFEYSRLLPEKHRKMSFKDKHLIYIESNYRHYFVNTKGDFNQYLNRFSKKTLATLKRKIKKIISANEPDQYFKIYSTPEEIEDFFEKAKAISDKSYQERLFGHGLPDTDEFKARIMQQASENMVQAFILFVKNKPAAYNLCPIYDSNKMLYDFTGYDPEYSKYSTGTILQYKIIESLFDDDRIDYYDLCTGEGQHKELYATDSKLCGNIYYFPQSPLYIIPVFIKLILDGVNCLAKSIFSRLGILERIKKWIRRKA